MAKVAGKSAAVYYGIVNLSSFFSNADVTREASALEVTGLGDDARKYIPGVRGGTASLSGFYGGDQDETDEKLSNSLASSDGEVVTVMPEGLVVGNRAVVFKARTTRYSLSSPVDGVGTASGDIQADGGIFEGHVLHTDADEVTSDGDDAAVDNEASTAEGGLAHLHVPEADDDEGGELTAMIEHSATGLFAGEQSVLAEFSVVAGQPTSERVEVPAGTTVLQYTRAVWTIEGGTSPRWKMMIAFGRRK